MSSDKRPELRGPINEKRRRLEKQHRAPRIHEESTASVLGGHRQKGSGSCYDAKGDVAGVGAQCFEFHGECKTTHGMSLRVEAQWLNKITSEAVDLFRYPFLAIRFQKDTLDKLASKLWIKLGRPVVAAEQDWIVIPRSVFVKMLDKLCTTENDRE